MMNQEQTSSAVYGLFYKAEYETPDLLGLYYLEGEAEAARAHFIALDLEDFSDADQWLAEKERLEKEAVIIRRLAIGQAPSWKFSS